MLHFFPSLSLPHSHLALISIVIAQFVRTDKHAPTHTHFDRRYKYTSNTDRSETRAKWRRERKTNAPKWKKNQIIYDIRRNRRLKKISINVKQWYRTVSFSLYSCQRLCRCLLVSTPLLHTVVVFAGTTGTREHQQKGIIFYYFEISVQFEWEKRFFSLPFSSPMDGVSGSTQSDDAAATAIEGNKPRSVACVRRENFRLVYLRNIVQ